MENIYRIDRFEDSISFAFYIDDESVMEIGRKLEEINENAYMNGENWAAVLDKYLELNDPKTAELLDSDPEADMYAAVFELSDDGEKAAQRLADIIQHFMDDPDILYDFVREYGEEIEWD